MKRQHQIYRESLSMLTDLYQITMVYAAWKNGFAFGQSEKKANFNLYFRNNPFQGGYAIACGLSDVLDFIENFKFTSNDTEYLSTLCGSDQKPLFEKAFLQFLEQIELNIDVDAIEEGRVVFANEPLLRVQGPLIQCQLLETPLLNMINFQTLIATKTARVKEAAGQDAVIEFGLRRAQGVDGSLAASKAAYIGGADATSNVLAGKFFDIPVRGTHAHSWVMALDDEQDAFDRFAAAMPNNTVLLVDTYNSIEGVKKAIQTARKLRQNGNALSGIRLDSGDLAYLSIESRKLLDEAGFPNVKIVASNDLDENLIQNLKAQGARIDVWGVGTKMITGFDQPALGGVYKLTAVRSGEGPWQPKLKLSEQMAKTTTQGIHQVRRYQKDAWLDGDMIYDVGRDASTLHTIVDPTDPTKRKHFAPQLPFEDLLKPTVRNGQVVLRTNLREAKKRREQDLQILHPAIKRFLNPHSYPVGLEMDLWNEKNKMILEIRERMKNSHE